MAPPEADRCDVIIYRAHTGTVQTFPLSSSGVLRVGRGMANDVVLDFNGVSVYHAELYLRPSVEPGQAGKQLLCIRDSSKNGTGVRPGPYSLVGEAAGPNPAWEPLKRDTFRVMEHGWQLMVPLRSRKESLQLPEAWRTLTIFVGRKPAGLPGTEEVDGEAWEPMLSKVVAPAFGAPPPPPPDLGGGAFEEAPPPPPEALRAAAARAEDDGSEDERVERKRGKKDKKAKRRQAEEADSGSDDSVKEKKKKKDKKKKQAEEKRGRKPEALEAKGDKDKAQLERKKREEREERERLERELEDELAEELNRTARTKRAGDDEDDGMSIHTGFSTHAAKKAGKTKAGKKGADEDSDAEEDDDLKSAWSRALGESEAKARSVTTRAAAASDRASNVAVAHMAVGTSAAPAAALPAVVEVLDSEKAAGIFLRCGAHSGQPMFRRLKDDAEPVFTYYWNGAGDESCAGWYVATNPEGKAGHDDYFDFWKFGPSLPVTGKGECGGRMECRSQLDGPALLALAQLPEGVRRTVRNAFTATGASAKGVLEEEAASESGREAAGESPAGVADASPAPASEGSLPPWKRRRGLRAAAKAEEGGASASEAGGEATQASEQAAGGAEAPKEEAGAPAKKEGEAAPGEAPSAQATAEGAEASAEAAEGSAVRVEESATEPLVAMVVAKEEVSGAAAAAAERPQETPPLATAEGEGVKEAMGEPGAEVEVKEAPGDAAAASGDVPMAAADEEAAVEVAAAAPAQAAEPAAPAESVAATDGTNVELAKAGEPTEGDATEPAGPDGIGAPVDEAGPTEADRRAAAAEQADDNASEPSRVSFTTTAPQKTVPGDRGESAAPTIPPADQLRGESEAPPPKAKPARKGMGLTKEALAAHTAALARAQAEAYAATFASARSHYSKSVAGRSVAGRTAAGMSVAGRSIAGRSIAGRSIAGKSIAASGVAPTERTFRTHMTTRELLVGGSEMRELMRSVSPISEPGVNVKVRKGRRNKKSPTRELTPATTRVSVSPTTTKITKKQKKKEKKEKKLKLKAAKKAARPATTSPSHFAAGSEMRASATPCAAASTAASGPTHWRGGQAVSETPELRPRAAKPKKSAAALRAGRLREASPLSEEGGDRPKKKKRGKARGEDGAEGDTKRRKRK